MEDNDNLIWTAHDFLDLQTKKIPSALVNIFVALYFVQYAVTLTKILCTTSRRPVTNHFTTRRRADNTCNTPSPTDWQFCTTRPRTDTKHLASRRRDTTSYYTPSGWIIVHRMKLCHSVKWNVTERLLKCDWLAYLYNSVTFQLTFSWVNGRALSCDQIYNKRIVNDAWIILLWFLNSLLDKQN